MESLIQRCAESFSSTHAMQEEDSYESCNSPLQLIPVEEIIEVYALLSESCGHEEENNCSVVQEERFENHGVEPVSKKRKVENDSDIHQGTPLLSELESHCEPYQEHYDVPSGAEKTDQRDSQCGKAFCARGCVCESLSCGRLPTQHCKRVGCMFTCKCKKSPKVRAIEYAPSTSNHEPKTGDSVYQTLLDVFGKLLNDKQSSNSKDELKESVDKMKNELNEKDVQIEQLKHLLNNAGMVSTFSSQVTESVPELVSAAKYCCEMLKEIKEFTCREKSEANVLKGKLETVGAASGAACNDTTCDDSFANVNVAMKSKNEPVSDNGRLQVKGVYLDFFPFNEKRLDAIAEENTAPVFVRQLMREMFTFDYLSTTYMNMMDIGHLNAIIEAALKRFKFYHHRNGQKSPLTHERVKYIINSELGAKRSERKKKLNC